MNRPVLICAACAAALALCLTACGKKEDTPSSDPVTTTTTTAAMTTTTTAAAIEPAVGYINATTLHVRPNPNTEGEPIGGLKYGDRVELLGREGDWYKIPFKDGTAYISAQFVQDTPPGETTAAATTTTTTVAATDETTTTTATTTAAPVAP